MSATQPFAARASFLFTSSGHSTERLTDSARCEVLTSAYAIIVAAHHSDTETWESALVPVEELGPEHRMRSSISIDDATKDVTIHPIPFILIDFRHWEGAVAKDQIRCSIDICIRFVRKPEVVSCFLNAAIYHQSLRSVLTHERKEAAH